MTTLYIGNRPFPGIVNIVNEATFERRAYAPVRECRIVWNDADRTWECSACGRAVGLRDVAYCESCGAKAVER